MNRSFHLPGKPQQDCRPRVLKTGRAYMPKHVTDYRLRLKLAYLKVYPSKPMITGAFSISVRVAIPRPMKHFGTGKNAGVLKKQFKRALHVQRPDIDNFVKMALDALNGVAFLDDSQCIQLRDTSKYWTHNVENEGAMFIEISEISA